MESVTSNHSPAYIEQANHGAAYIEPTNHGATYVEPGTSGEVYVRTVSPSSSVYVNPAVHNIPFVPASPKAEHLTNQNGGVSHRPSNMVPYMETPTSTMSECSDTGNDVIVVSRMNSTPSGSPLTFIKEEPNEDGSTDIL